MTGGDFKVVLILVEAKDKIIPLPPTDLVWRHGKG